LYPEIIYKTFIAFLLCWRDMEDENKKEKRWQRFLLDLLFPPSCQLCGRAGGYLCLNCLKAARRAASRSRASGNSGLDRGRRL